MPAPARILRTLALIVALLPGCASAPPRPSPSPPPSPASADFEGPGERRVLLDGLRRMAAEDAEAASRR